MVDRHARGTSTPVSTGTQRCPPSLNHAPMSPPCSHGAAVRPPRGDLARFIRHGALMGTPRSTDTAPAHPRTSRRCRPGRAARSSKAEPPEARPLDASSSRCRPVVQYMQPRSGSCATAVGSDGAGVDPAHRPTAHRAAHSFMPRLVDRCPSVIQRPPTSYLGTARDITLESGVEHTIHARNHGVALRGARQEVA